MLVGKKSTVKKLDMYSLINVCCRRETSRVAFRKKIFNFWENINVDWVPIYAITNVGKTTLALI